jgi:hypothetical protein
MFPLIFKINMLQFNDFSAALVMALICEAADVAQASAAWDLILSWCITNGNSLLEFPVDAITEGGDKHLANLINQRLDTMFGPRPSSGIPWNAGMWGSVNPHDAT